MRGNSFDGSVSLPKNRLGIRCLYSAVKGIEASREIIAIDQGENPVLQETAKQLSSLATFMGYAEYFMLPMHLYLQVLFRHSLTISIALKLTRFTA